MATYLLRNVDDTLWRQAKVKAAREGVSLRTLILELLRAWLAA